MFRSAGTCTSERNMASISLQHRIGLVTIRSTLMCKASEWVLGMRFRYSLFASAQRRVVWAYASMGAVEVNPLDSTLLLLAGCDLGGWPGRNKGAAIDVGRGIIPLPPRALAYRRHIFLDEREI